jgi:hypothetical protein
VIFALIVVVVALALGVGAGFVVQATLRSRALSRRAPLRRIAFPFTGNALSEPALVAALRVAHAENAKLVPVYLAVVPRSLPLEVPLRGECETALPLLEAVEQRASRAGVQVDSRIERGRSPRHALGQLMEHEQFDRMVVAAASQRNDDGFTSEEVAWLLNHARSEVLVLRPARDSAGTLRASSLDTSWNRALSGVRRRSRARAPHSAP